MKGVSRFVLAMLAASAVVDIVGFAFGLFYAGLFYDNLAHFLTTFSLVALATELYLSRERTIQRRASYVTASRALAAGAALALVGGVAWEGFEALLDQFMPEMIYNPLLDSMVDTSFGVAGGAFGTWLTIRRSSPGFHLGSTKSTKKP